MGVSEMMIGGLQRLTLLDYPGKTACTVFTSGCDLRCPFCHNALLVTKTDEIDSLPDTELFHLLSKRRGTLDGVCITGGEPLMQHGIEELMKQIKDRGFLVKLDTNGTYPKKLASVMKNGLADYIAMDIKSSPSGYPAACGIPGFDIAPVKESIDLIKNSGTEYEFRTTVVKGIHTEDDIIAAAQMIKGADKYFLQAYVDSGELINDSGLSAFTAEEMNDMLTAVKPFVKYSALRGI